MQHIAIRKLVESDAEAIHEAVTELQEDQAKCANLGYWVRTSATGSGVAPIAVRQAATRAFSTTELHRLEIVVAVKNVRSIRVAEIIDPHSAAPGPKQPVIS